MNLCSYGCGQEAIFTFKNGKHCCSKNVASCPISKIKIKEKQSGERNSFFKHKHSDLNKKNWSLKRSGNNHPLFETKRSEETKYKIRIKRMGVLASKETKEKMSRTRKGRIPWNKNLKNCFSIESIQRMKESHKNTPKESRKNQKRWMLNGGAAHANRFLKNPSKEQIKLFEICQKILPYSILNYPVYNPKGYSIDIAIPKLELAIEYDGYWHFNSDDRKEYDIKRQKEIEEEGWKFLRYNIFQKFPTLEQVKKDVMNLLN